MSDLKLFKINSGNVEELTSHSVKLEKSLQTVIETHLEAFFGVRFLASEYSTGPKHGGRIDTLGIDENGCPVIFEYKRSISENIINQGLYYLDWLLDHKSQFEMLVLKKWDSETADSIEWSSPQLKCVASDYNKYDVHAIKQINRNIELILYRKYSDDLILFELVHSTSSETNGHNGPAPPAMGKSPPKTFAEYLETASKEQLDQVEAIKALCLSLGDDVQYKILKLYGAFKRLKNFCCMEVHPQTKNILLYLKVNPDTLELEEGFSRDVRNVGHYGTGPLEIKIKSMEDFEKAEPLIIQSYEIS